jgi:hypothetical protein
VDDVDQLARGPQTFEERAQHLGGMWAQQTRDWVLTWLGVGHNYFHLGEAEHEHERWDAQDFDIPSPVDCIFPPISAGQGRPRNTVLRALCRRWCATQLCSSAIAAALVPPTLTGRI